MFPEDLTTSLRSILVSGVIASSVALPTLLKAAPVQLFDETPVAVEELGKGHWLVDFGKVTFGNVKIDPGETGAGTITVHFGEAFDNGRINRKPPGTVRYARVEANFDDGSSPLIVAPPADQRNTTHASAIRTPEEFGVVLPFRWLEIEGWNGQLKPEQITRKSLWLAAWDDDAASFRSSNETLDRIWELCRHSIKATTFAGVYVDGDRERIPYEADAYINQLCHYGTDNDVQIARDTFDQLMKAPTWPTEWAPHMVFMAHADWLHTGDADWLQPRYESLKSKLLSERVGDHGLVTSDKRDRERDDIVDWPHGERDGYIHTALNTVVNAFHLEAIRQISVLAKAVGKDREADAYAADHAKKLAEFNRRFFIESKGIYRDGEGTDHSSLHASLFPLAFGLVPDGREGDVADFLADRGMRCSVYAAQYLMEGLFRAGRDEEAMDLILADNDRSWKHMVESGTTITWEAWDQKYKPNQDWNHAWGAAPANLIPRFVLGAEPIEPGWKKVRIQPRLSGLDEAEGTVPTPLGPVKIHWKKTGQSLGLKCELPDGMEAEVILPEKARGSKVFINNQQVSASRTDGWLTLTEPLRGEQKVIVR